MLNKVKRFIASEHLLRVDALYLIALSGGADSVALLLLLKNLGYRIEAVHCNFHLRGEMNSFARSYVNVRIFRFTKSILIH